MKKNTKISEKLKTSIEEYTILQVKHNYYNLISNS